MKAHVVLGANYGGEGKGLLTDYLSHDSGFGTVVVRANGGPHVGHTVTTPCGLRHVFSHVGAGAFNLSSTYLGRQFVADPALYDKERKELARLGYSPLVFSHPGSLISVPFDREISAAVEIARGGPVHGTGVNEAIFRSSNPEFRITRFDLENRESLLKRFFAIRDKYVPKRLKAVGASDEAIRKLNDPDLPERFLSECEEYRKEVRWASPSALRTAKHLVFEGIEGILKDRDYGCKPYASHWNTGLTSVVELAKEARIRELEVLYASRPYVTRYGWGPMDMEVNDLPYPKANENPPQPSRFPLRYGLLDLFRLAEALEIDRTHAPFSEEVRVTQSLALTCFDQVEFDAEYAENGARVVSSPERLIERAAKLCGVRTVSLSSGPTREDIEELAF